MLWTMCPVVPTLFINCQNIYNYNNYFNTKYNYNSYFNNKYN